MGFLDRLFSKKRVNFTELVEKGALIIDVRSIREFANGSVSGAENIPLQILQLKIRQIPRNLPIILCCASGTRSGMALRTLTENGYKEVYNAGSWMRLESKLKNGK